MTPDWIRNFGSCITERLRVKVEWAKYLVDLRIGFLRAGRWTSSLHFWTSVTQNFWNGIFTFNLYVIKTHLWRMPVLIPRVNLVIRPFRNYWLETGIGYLFDRGEFGGKLVLQSWANAEIYNPGVNAKGWEEGAV